MVLDHPNHSEPSPLGFWLELLMRVPQRAPFFPPPTIKSFKRKVSPQKKPGGFWALRFFVSGRKQETVFFILKHQKTHHSPLLRALDALRILAPALSIGQSKVTGLGLHARRASAPGVVVLRRRRRRRFEEAFVEVVDLWCFRGV